MNASDAEVTASWAQDAAEVLARLGVDQRRGLTEAEVERLLARHGPNVLRSVAPPSAWRILVQQFASLIVLLLAVAALAAFLFEQWLEGASILAVLALNALIGFVTELRARDSMQALRSLGRAQAKVRRGGHELEIPADRLVPGDVVVLEAGDVVTADLRLLSASKLQADESTLTGESTPVNKHVEPVALEAALPDRSSMLFKGTSVPRGSAESVVVATGMNTELGRIASLVQSSEEERTPLEHRLSELGRRLIGLTVVIAALTAGVGIANGKPLWPMVETGIALAVAAIPEGLPIVATVAMARGLWRMARRNVLVNRLSSVETLGATTVVFSDKTGTLTENRMAVRRLGFLDEAVDATNGSGLRSSTDARVRALLEAAVLCNNAALSEEEDGEGIGDPMEVALLALGALGDVRREELWRALPEVREEAFDADTRMMATFNAEDGAYRVAVKGAPEAVIAASTAFLTADGEPHALDETTRARWERIEDELAADGLRVLGIAQRTASTPDEEPYRDLVLLGMVGFADPPRTEVRGALAACRRAGLRVVMVTGDHRATAESIGRAVELVPQDEPVHVVLGTELARASELGEEDGRELLAAPIYARVSPEQKLELIEVYQRAGEVVAMTGDGVNDAPALKKADIGVAMGKRGTQVAREAADMVLTDDAFASIVTAVEQGRTIFDNIRKFIFYLLSCNASELMLVGLAAGVDTPLPLLPLQILFLNLVTDVFPALALALGRSEPDVLERPPRDPSEPLVTRGRWFEILGYGFVIATTVFATFQIARGVMGVGDELAVTVSFVTLAAAQLWHVFDVRSPHGGILRNEVTANGWVWGALALCVILIAAAVYVPGLRDALHTSPPPLRAWLLAGGMSLVPLALGQLWLVARGRRSRNG